VSPRFEQAARIRCGRLVTVALSRLALCAGCLPFADKPEIAEKLRAETREPLGSEAAVW
jgi:hypothetical protein